MVHIKQEVYNLEQSYIDLYCESSNAHYARILAPAHSAFSGNITLTLPAATDTLVGKATTDTLTNKTLTSPKITLTLYIYLSRYDCRGGACSDRRVVDRAACNDWRSKGFVC